MHAFRRGTAPSSLPSDLDSALRPPVCPAHIYTHTQTLASPLAVVGKPEPNAKPGVPPVVEAQVLPSKMAGIDALWAMATTPEHAPLSEASCSFVWVLPACGPGCRLAVEPCLDSYPVLPMSEQHVTPIIDSATRKCVSLVYLQAAAEFLVMLYTNVTPGATKSTLTHRSAWEQFATACISRLTTATATATAAASGTLPAAGAPAAVATLGSVNAVLGLILRFVTALNAKGPVRAAKTSAWGLFILDFFTAHAKSA